MSIKLGHNAGSPSGGSIWITRLVRATFPATILAFELAATAFGIGVAPFAAVLLAGEVPALFIAPSAVPV